MGVAELAVPAFIAGLFTFFAPCTLPLVPGFLGFISGVSLDDLRDASRAAKARRRIFFNGVLYVVGFSIVFILLGSLVGLGGYALLPYRSLLARIGGVFIVLFGIFMVIGTRIPLFQFLSAPHQLSGLRSLKPGTPSSSLLFGATFALGWTPCVGPILGSILILAATSTTVFGGAFLLSVFSLGMALPFLLIAASIGQVSIHVHKLPKILEVISVIGGIFLIFMGVLVITDSFAIFTAWFYGVFSFLQLEERLLDYL